MDLEAYTGPRLAVCHTTEAEVPLDPLRVIKYYKGCKLKPAKIQMDSFQLGSVWKLINSGRNLKGDHDSLVDAKAQTDVLLHP